MITRISSVPHGVAGDATEYPFWRELKGEVKDRSTAHIGGYLKPSRRCPG
jgi:hypothetical protein